MSGDVDFQKKANAKHLFFEIEDEILELTTMAKLALLAVADGDGEATAFAARQLAEKVREPKERYDELREAAS